MIISAKGRYALCVMIDLAENNNGSYIPMKEVAERQGLPFKYLARIMPILARNHVVDTIPGKSGGYRLNRKPEEYTLGEILRLIDGKFAPVACLAYGTEPCEQASQCRTLPVWKNLQNMVDSYLDSITLKDLMCRE